MASTDLKLDEPGSLPRPGPVGRLARIAFGVVCLWYLRNLIAMSGDLMAADGSIRDLIWDGVLVGLLLVSYVVNIGFSRAWKKWPAFVSLVVLTAVAGVGYALTGTIETNILASSIWIWELYIFSHLGAAFVIAAVIATPGCELRAFHDLYSKLTGIPSKEHFCPCGPLDSIDKWEAGRRR